MEGPITTVSPPAKSARKYQLAVLQSHPVQYFAPMFRELAIHPEIDLMVYYCSKQGVQEYVDSGFRCKVKWDTDLLTGYNYTFLSPLIRDAGVKGFFSLINPAIVRELIVRKYDALFLHGYTFLTHLVAIAVSKGIGTSVFIRGETHLRLKRTIFRRSMRQSFLTILYRHLCDACLPIGSLNREYYRSHGVAEDRLFSVPYTVDNAFFIREIAKHQAHAAEIKTGIGVAQDKRVILYASKLMKRKRPMDLIRAFERSRKAGIDAALVIVGTGEQENELRSYVDRHRLPDVHFCGFQNQLQISKFYAIADVFVLPSEDEPWGLVINEVMCAGVPIIASEEIGAVPDLVKHGENGLLYSAGDVDALAASLQEILTDYPLCRKMGHESLRLIENWNYDACVSGVLGALKRTVTKRA